MSTSQMDTIDSSSNIMIVENVINTSNIINHDVIEDQQQILLHQPQQHQNLKIIQQDESGHYTIEGAIEGSGGHMNNQNNKVQIISNVTLVPKAQPQQQIHQQTQQISYVTTNKGLGNSTYMNAMLTGKSSAATLTAGGKLINVPLKSTTKQQQQQQQQHLQTASIITTNTMQMQKMQKIPYRIQPVTSNIIIQRSSPATTTLASSQQLQSQRVVQQHQQQQQSQQQHLGQIIQSKTTNLQPQNIKTTNYYIQQPQQQQQQQQGQSVTPNNNNSISYNKNKPVAAATSVKFLTEQQATAKMPVRSIGATTKQLQIQQLQTKNSSYKQAATTNCNSGALGNKIKYVAPVKSLANTQQHLQLPQQQQVVYQTTKTVQHVSGAKKITKMQQHQQNQQIYLQQQQPNSHQRTNSIIYNQGSVQKVVTKSSKFLVQNSVGGGGAGGTHYVLPSSNMTASNVGNTPNKYSSQTNSYDPATDQDHHHQQKNANNYMGNKQVETISPIFGTTSTIKNQNSPSSTATSTYNNSNSEIMIVNGAAVTEEMSARILQRLSQGGFSNQQQSTNYNKYQGGDESTRQQRFTTRTASSPVKGDAAGDYHKNSDQPQTITTFIDNIPLTSVRNDSRLDYDTNKWNQNEPDDEMIGIEIRPQPVNSTDLKILSLHAVLQDHTYYTPSVTPPPPLPAPPPLTPQPQLPRSSLTSMNEMTVSTTGIYSRDAMTNSHGGSNSNLNIMTNAMMMSPGHPGVYNFSKSQVGNNDDDNNSVISTGSRNDVNNDLGEETETAPEGEGEDDSITRCICDLTHDDGYMICCDKCSVWQHVDCMGIDRLNIPDEYKCELCQPRYVDKGNARALQIIKRKQQQQQQQLLASGVLPPFLNEFEDPNLIKLPPLNQQKMMGSGVAGANRKSGGKSGFGSAGTTPKKNKDTMALSKRKRTDSLGRNNGKPRKEGKRTNKKRQPKNSENASGTTVKPTSAVRSWIENYEYAVTNHYSPELRARLQAIGKQQPHNLNSSGFEQFGNSSTVNISQLLENDQKCTTVPHAGGKILISVVELENHTPIIEIRGKYMLSSQQHKLMGSSKSANKQLQSGGAGPGGPFLFSYRIPNVQGLELCVDTRTYGNDARFVRRSCRPNAEILHTIEKGVVHLFLVANTKIVANTEITIKHDDVDVFGNGVPTVPQTCACGLVKDCLYMAHVQQIQLQQHQQQQQLGLGQGLGLSGLPPNAITSTPNLPKKTLKRKNGNLNEEKRPYRKRNKMAPGIANVTAAEGRTRSSSSSCESSMSGLLSPPMFFPSSSSLINQIITPPIIISAPPSHSMMSVITANTQATAHNHTFSPPHTPTHSSIMSQLPPSLPPPLMLVEQHQALQKSLSETRGNIDVVDAPVNYQPTIVQEQPQQHEEVEEQTATPIVESQFIIPPQLHSETVLISMTPVQVDASVGGQGTVEQLVNIADCPIVIAEEKECEVIMEQSTEIYVEATGEDEEVVHQHQQLHQRLASPLQQVQIIQENPQAHQQDQQQMIHVETANLMVVNPTVETNTNPLVSPTIYVPAAAAPDPPMQTSPAATRSSKKERPPKFVRNNQPHPSKAEVRLQSPPATQQSLQHHHPVVLAAPHQAQLTLSSPLSSPGGGIDSPREHKPPPVKAKTLSHPKPHHPKETVAPKEPKEPKETKKLTRDERKLEAYMRAFEKMERNQARKQEAKQPKTTPNPKKRTSSSSSSTANTPLIDGVGNPMSPMDATDHDHEPNVTTASSVKRKIVSSPHKRKKRKLKASVGGGGGTSLSKYKGKGAKTPSKRWPSKNDSGSDHMMSPNKTGSPHLMSPKPHEMGGHYSCASLSMLQQHHNPLNKAADMLLSLHQGNNVSYSSPISSPSRSSRSQPNVMLSPPPVISSACMLIEAAVGNNFEHLGTNSASGGSTADLNDQEFKFPTRTKTKKTMMNNWLHESQEQQNQFGVCKTSLRSHNNTQMVEQDSGYISEGNGTKLHAGTTGNVEYSSYVDYQSHDAIKREPDFCLAAQKVEEFISQTDNKYQSVIKNEMLVEDAQTSLKPFKAEDVTSTPFPVLQVNHAGSESAVKKRWLRQAISEECTEELVASPSPPPTNGFTTPLKKRRVIRECSNTTSDLATPEETVAMVPLALSSPPVIQQRVDESEVVQYAITTEEIKIENFEPKVELQQQTTTTIVQQYTIECDIKPTKMEPEQIDALNLTYVQESVEENETIVVLNEPINNVQILVEHDENVIVPSSQSPKQQFVESLPSEFVKKESSEPPKRDAKIDDDEFQIEAKSESDVLDFKNDFKAESSLKFEDVKDENCKVEEEDGKPLNDDMEDIQKKIASFHSENILILKSRNKKSKSLQSTPTSESQPSQKRPTSGKKSSIQLNFDLNVDENDQTVSVELKKSDSDRYSPTSSFSEITSSAEVSPQKIEKEKEKEMVVDEEPYRPATVPSYFHSSSLGSAPSHQPMFMTEVVHQMPQLTHPQLYQQPSANTGQLLTSAPPPPLTHHQHHAAASFIPQTNYTSFLPAQPPPPGPTAGLTEYLESTNKLLYSRGVAVPHRNDSHSLAPVYKTSILDTPYHHIPSQPVSSAPGYTTYQPSSTLLQQSHVVGNNVVGASQSQLMDDCNALSRSQLAYPKIYTKTASFDPRLNPSLAIPDPEPAPITPKRKLSLTEYRKRKMQSTESNTSDTSSTKETSNSGLDNPMTSEASNSDLAKDGGGSGSDTSDSIGNASKGNCDQIDPILFSPTLAELQSESLSERLKSYKSFSSCTTTDEPTISTMTPARTLSTESESSSSLSSTQNELTTAPSSPPPPSSVVLAVAEDPTTTTEN